MQTTHVLNFSSGSPAVRHAQNDQEKGKNTCKWGRGSCIMFVCRCVCVFMRPFSHKMNFAGTLSELNSDFSLRPFLRLTSACLVLWLSTCPFVLEQLSGRAYITTCNPARYYEGENGRSLFSLWEMTSRCVPFSLALLLYRCCFTHGLGDLHTELEEKGGKEKDRWKRAWIWTRKAEKIMWDRKTRVRINKNKVTIGKVYRERDNDGRENRQWKNSTSQNKVVMSTLAWLTMMDTDGWRGLNMLNIKQAPCGFFWDFICICCFSSKRKHSIRTQLPPLTAEGAESPTTGQWALSSVVYGHPAMEILPLP